MTLLAWNHITTQSDNTSYLSRPQTTFRMFSQTSSFLWLSLTFKVLLKNCKRTVLCSQSHWKTVPVHRTINGKTVLSCHSPSSLVICTTFWQSLITGAANLTHCHMNAEVPQVCWSCAVLRLSHYNCHLNDDPLISVDVRGMWATPASCELQ